jgi:quercetin dioxygenase-like cupin family protein
MEQPTNAGQTTSTTKGKAAILWLGELTIMHVTGKDTGGRFSMVELYATKEGEVPWHIHHREDEGFYVLEGEMTIYVGEKVMKAKPGDFVFAPKDVPHRYTVDTPGFARVLMTFSPAGFEDFIRETSEPAASLTPPPPQAIAMDMEELMQVAARYGAEFIQPAEEG